MTVDRQLARMTFVELVDGLSAPSRLASREGWVARSRSELGLYGWLFTGTVGITLYSLKRYTKYSIVSRPLH